LFQAVIASLAELFFGNRVQLAISVAQWHVETESRLFRRESAELNMAGAARMLLPAW
jgi:hypothetical protein